VLDAMQERLDRQPEMMRVMRILGIGEMLRVLRT